MQLKSIGLAIATALTLVMGSSAQATLYTNTNGPVVICDLCDVSSTLTVTSHTIITDLNAILNSLPHTFDNDLLISLIAPNATTVVLSNHHGGSSNNYTNTVFDDEASTAIANGSAPFSGSFRPDGLLSAFDGLDAFGTWTLRVQDQVGLDDGRINSWSLDITGATFSTTQNVPEPGSLALMGLGLAGLAVARRRKSA